MAVDSQGYEYKYINGKKVRLHRHVYEQHYGPIPSNLVIDHINRNKLDNRIENLRAVTRKENSRNNGAKGYYKHYNKFRATITDNYKAIDLGLYGTECAARLAYLMAKLKISLA